MVRRLDREVLHAFLFREKQPAFRMTGLRRMCALCFSLKIFLELFHASAASGH